MVQYDDECLVFQDISLHYCDTRFGYYGRFATLLLRAALIKDNVYTLTRFQKNLEYSSVSPRSSARYAQYIRSLDFPDSDFFTLDEIRFLIQLRGPCPPLTKQQIESDRQELRRETRKIGKICKSHAVILLKALSFWELRYSEKCDEWMVTMREACNEHRREGYIMSTPPANNVEDVDEGYESS